MADPFSTTASFVGNLISNLFNWGSTKKTNEQNLQIAREINQAQQMLQDMANQANIAIANATNQANIGMQRETNEANIAMQRETNEANIGMVRDTNLTNIGMVRETNLQQRQLQHEAWQREDNATQRRVADLRAAGLNPVLAAGSAAQASGPIQLNTPRAESPRAESPRAETPQMRHMAQMQAAQLKAAHMQIAQIETDMVERALRMRDDFATNEKTRNLLDATADEHRAKTDEIKRLNMEAGETWGLRVTQLKQQIELQGRDIALKTLEEESRILSIKGQKHINRGYELDNIRRGIENYWKPLLNSKELDHKDVQIASLAIANEMEKHDFNIRKIHGTTKQGSFYEKLIYSITGALLEADQKDKSMGIIEQYKRRMPSAPSRNQDWMHQMY